MNVTASTLRSNIYKMLDHVLETGESLTVARKGGLIEISPVSRSGKLNKLIKHDCIIGDPESFVHLDWSGEWKGDVD